MKIVLPITRTQEVFKVEPQQGSILFDPMKMVGHSEHTSLRPNDWSYINNIADPKVISYSKGKGALFVDIYKLANEPSLDFHKSQLMELAHSLNLVEKTTYYAVSWKDGNINLGSTYHRNYLEALEASNGREDLIQSLEGIVGTPALAERIGVNEDLLIRKGELYAIAGALQELSAQGMNIDGIYWSEEYESNSNMTEIMSIFPNKSNQWSQSIAALPNYDDLLNDSKTPTYQEMFGLPRKGKELDVAVSF